MRRLSLALMLAGCCLLAAGATAAPTREVQLERLAMHWPAGYTIVWYTHSTHLLRADGQKAIVRTHGPAPEADEPPLAAAAHRRLAELGAKHVGEAAVRFGSLLAPLARAELPDGSILLSAASEKPGTPPRRYLLQFSVVERAGSTAYITVEGKGATLPEYQRLLPLFQTVRWIRRNALDDPAPEFDACAPLSPSSC